MPKSRADNSWHSWFDAARFGYEVQTVIAYRMMRLASGGSLANTEAQRMVMEKMTAMAEAQTQAVLALASGASFGAAMTQAMIPVRRRVRANRRRLSKS